MNIFWILFNKWERFAIAALGIFTVFTYINLLGKNTQISKLKNDINRSKINYNLLFLQHKNLVHNIELQNAAIDKMKIDAITANKKYIANNKALEEKYNSLLIKYRNTDKCDTILKLNREFYNSDKGVNYVK